MDTAFIDSMNMINNTNIWSMFCNVFSNTGNLVFSEYCKTQINYTDIYKLNVDWCEMSHDKVYVLPLSNNLSPDETNFTRLLYRIARYDLNIVPIGLGVQADMTETPKSFVNKLPGRKKRLFQKLAYNTTTIGVRGEFTAECLELLGIRNIRVIGCPSFYSNILNSNDKICFDNLSCESERRICVNWDMNMHKKIVVKGKNKTMVSEKYVLQTAPEYITSISIGNNKEFVFFSIEDWSNWLKSNNFSAAFGNRFHGNMICYLNGIPTLWCIKDMRMRELSETLGIPSVYMKSQDDYLLEYDKVFCEDLYPQDFYDKRIALRKEYISFLDENGVKHKFTVELL